MGVKRLEEERENALQKVEELGGGSNMRIEPDRNSTRIGEKQYHQKVKKLLNPRNARYII